MKALQDKETDAVICALEDTIAYFLSNYDFQKMSLPLIKNTYTLWRNYAFKAISKMQVYHQRPQETVQLFSLVSECQYLKQFINQLDAPAELDMAGGSAKNANQNARQLELMADYSKILWKHALYCELFIDFISLPYLKEIFPSNKVYTLKARFLELSPIQNNQNEGQIMEKVSEGVLKKGFGEIVEKIFTKTFLLRASSIAIKLNPFAIAATFAFSSLLEYYRKEKKEGELLSKLQEMIQKCHENIEILINCYEECIGLLRAYLKGEFKSKETLQERVSEVIQEDWLQVIKYKDEDGWEIVVLQGSPSEQV